MDRETVKAMNALSKKINDVQAKLDKFAQILHTESMDKIDENSNGVFDLAALSDENSESVFDLAELYSELDSRVTTLEEKE